MNTNASSQTQYFGLPLFAGTDKPSVLTDWNGTMEELDTVLEDYRTRIAGCEQTTASFMDQVNILKNKMQEITARIAGDEDLIQENALEIAGLKEALIVADTSIKRILTQIAEMGDEIADLSSLSTTVESLLTRVSSLESRMTTNEDSTAEALYKVRAILSGMSILPYNETIQYAKNDICYVQDGRSIVFYKFKNYGTPGIPVTDDRYWSIVFSSPNTTSDFTFIIDYFKRFFTTVQTTKAMNPYRSVSSTAGLHSQFANYFKNSSKTYLNIDDTAGYGSGTSRVCVAELFPENDDTIVNDFDYVKINEIVFKTTQKLPIESFWPYVCAVVCGPLYVENSGAEGQAPGTLQPGHTIDLVAGDGWSGVDKHVARNVIPEYVDSITEDGETRYIYKISVNDSMSIKKYDADVDPEYISTERGKTQKLNSVWLGTDSSVTVRSMIVNYLPIAK